MISLLKSLTDQVITWLRDDPVRPEVPFANRIGDNAEIFTLPGEDRPFAITCVAYMDFVPASESRLFVPTEAPTTAVFYTIWSYRKGAGRELILEAVDYIKKNRPEITRFVTLSPKTSMAEQFHLKNGAVVFRENENTVNYEYMMEKKDDKQ